MSDQIAVRFFRVARRDLVFLKFILEAYEGLSTMSTADRKEGIVRISFSEWGREDLGSLLDSLASEIGILEVAYSMEEHSA